MDDDDTTGFYFEENKELNMFIRSHSIPKATMFMMV
jgi:hypothetical protein